MPSHVWVNAVAAVSMLGSSAVAWAQSEPLELEATSVVIAQPVFTTLDRLDQSDGLTVRTLTKVADLSDDTGGTLSVFAVRIAAVEPAAGPATRPSDSSQRRGLSVVIAPRGGRPVRAYVDENDVARLIDGLTAMNTADRGGGPQTEVRGVYRYANLAVLQFDDAGGRTVAVRAVQVLPLTGQAIFGVARFQSPRLSDLVRALRLGKDAMARTTRP
jgi:hypothetical protein